VLLSIIVTVVDGGETLRRCLRALDAQQDAPPLEVIVPFDDSRPEVRRMAGEFPAFTFLDLGAIPTVRSAESAAGQHELFDRRRAAGLRAATGELIGMLEDRGAPRPDWAAVVTRLHAHPYAVIGGAVENGRDRLLNWAVYFCDFGRYRLPLAAGPAEYVTDVNLCYKRRALAATEPLWRDRYHETTVHWALRRAGETLFLNPEMVVDQFRENLQLRGLLSERFAWGRLFAYTRAREASAAKRGLLAALGPALPFVLFLRQLRLQHRKGSLRQFAAASPGVFVLLCSWCAGEIVGYITARP
jgi:hypothetical protein